MEGSGAEKDDSVSVSVSLEKVRNDRGSSGKTDVAGVDGDLGMHEKMSLAAAVLVVVVVVVVMTLDLALRTTLLRGTAHSAGTGVSGAVSSAGR